MKISKCASRFVCYDRKPQSRSHMGDYKVNFIAAFQGQELIAHLYLSNVKTVTNIEYINFLDRVFQLEIPIWRINIHLILESNARPLKHHEVKAFYTRHRWVVLRHRPYSPDLWPYDFDGFARIKRPNKGTRFTNFEELKTVYDVINRNLNEHNEFIGMEYMPQRWGTCIQILGEYLV